MNYAEALLSERSRTNIDRIAKVVGDDPEEFKKIVDIIYNEKAPLPQYAAWLLQVIAQKHPELTKPYIKRFTGNVEKQIGPVKRAMLVALTYHRIPAAMQSKVLDLCFRFMLDPKEEVAIKANAMTIAGNIVAEHPELAGELKAVIEDQWDRNTAAFKVRGRDVIKKIGMTTKLKVTHNK
jgi:hypothetical protein